MIPPYVISVDEKLLDFFHLAAVECVQRLQTG
jgi:hypothetical protein